MLDFEKILKSGAQGIIDDAQKEMDALDLTDPDSHKKRIFYESVTVSYTHLDVYKRQVQDIIRRAGSRQKASRFISEGQKRTTMF